MVKYIARMFPDPGDEAMGIVRREVFEVAGDGALVVSDVEARDHPEVPLSAEQRDAVLERLGYVRTGPWIEEGERAEASVRPH
ncbi:hypothetical protein [Nonomuraea pusilla]|uniref:Uncharacterized protein n=1 Tax=Nonomuraea pusilla TaxID=46177 RepID=A0A1H7IQ52_9ACTN|nr:hypothetical protein [Nonomuraea pusilla]SEK62885.1 hypothetical protein SAMN05660976_00837 [Nonomuraea pusilla]